jgi:thymidylate synthase ThyX
MKPSAKVIADSVSRRGHRLTTMEIVTHRFVLAEFNTHRVFSRNSASSRAIPVKKQLERVKTNPAYPLSWPSEKPGMQGGEELEAMEQELAKEVWDHARDAMVMYVELLQNLGLHKSVTNRLLEPFMWHTIIVSSTEWDNFFKQRVSPLAQPEIREVATLMQHALQSSIPTDVAEGQWHLPYVHADENLSTEVGKMCSVARIARVSRENHDTGSIDVNKDVDTYNMLILADPAHASPLEHVATPKRMGLGADYIVPGNFEGWEQLRHQVLGF